MFIKLPKWEHFLLEQYNRRRVMNEEKLPQPYEKFDLAVEDIKNNPDGRIRIGGGSESNVYAAKIDEENYAVKFAVAWTRLDRPRNTEAATQRKIDAGLRGLNVTGSNRYKVPQRKGVSQYIAL